MGQGKLYAIRSNLVYRILIGFFFCIFSKKKESKKSIFSFEILHGFRDWFK